MKRIIDEIVLPRFRSDDMSGGILLGSRAIVGEITRPVSWLEFHKWHLAAVAGIIMLGLSAVFFESRGQRGLAWLCTVGAVSLLWWLIRSVIFGKRESGFGGGSSGGGGATGSW
jgi:uncharacterized membrane protein YgcG